MKEFFQLLRKLRLKEIFFTPTQNGFIEFFRYLFVGGIATVVDWLFSFGTERACTLFSPIPPQPTYVIATTVGFCFGMITNFLLSRAFVFSAKTARAKTRTGEFLGHLTVGVTGLLLSYLIVWLGTSLLFDAYMPFRMIATAVVFFWNYLAKKFFVYKSFK